jgi:hypothetical protein
MSIFSSELKLTIETNKLKYDNIYACTEITKTMLYMYQHNNNVTNLLFSDFIDEPKIDTCVCDRCIAVHRQKKEIDTTRRRKRIRKRFLFERYEINGRRETMK